MSLALSGVYIHLAAAIVGVLAVALMATVPGRSTWIVVVLASACAALNAGAVVAELV